MTGAGPGKIKLEASVLVYRGACRRPVPGVEVYLHVKGWSRARVTHLDIEAPELPGLLGLKPGSGVYGVVYGTGGGLVFKPFKATWRVEVVEYRVIPRALPRGERVYGYLGGKEGGVFLGMESRILRTLESIARESYGVEPRGRARGG